MSDITLEKNGSRLTVKLSRPLDTENSPRLEAELMPQLDDVQELVIDLEHVGIVSSGGLRVLLTLSRRIDRNKGKMRVIHARRELLDIFELVNFGDFFTIEKN